MNLNELTSESLIMLDLDAKTKEDAIKAIVDKLDESGILSSKEVFLQAVLDREAISTTGLENGLAIPHAKSESVLKPSFAIARLATPLSDWESMDEDNQVSFIFMLAIPKSEQDTTHLEILSTLASSFMDDRFLESLYNAKTPKGIMTILSNTAKESSPTLVPDTGDFILAVTSCPVGVAHTYLAADALRKSAAEMGVSIKVETNGSIGVKGELTAEDISRAKCIIIAADTNVDLDRFDGKPIIQTSVKSAVRTPAELIRKALSEKNIYKSKMGQGRSDQSENTTTNRSRDTLGSAVYKHLMYGVSHMIPVVVVGGVLIALAIALSGIQPGEGAVVTNPILKQMLDLGVVAFGLMVPVLAGFISVSIAGRSGLAPGLIGGMLANNVGAGFLGGIVAGFAAGYIARWVRDWRVPKSLQPVMPVFVIPLVATGMVGILMGIIGAPIGSFMDMLTMALQNLNQGSILLALILGLMISFDMGGPVNKVAFLFGAALITEGVATVMGPIAVAICVPPLGMGLATLIAPHKFEREERDAGKAALAMGSIGITEGAIPFAATDPLRVIPANMIGAGVGAVIAALGSVADHAPHGGLIVLPVVDGKIMFVIAIIVGTITTATIVSVLKPKKQIAKIPQG